MLIPKRRRHFIYINKTVDAARHPLAASLWSVSRTYYIRNGICIVQEKLSVSALLRCSLLTRTAASTNSATYKFELYIPLALSLESWGRHISWTEKRNFPRHSSSLCSDALCCPTLTLFVEFPITELYHCMHCKYYAFYCSLTNGFQLRPTEFPILMCHCSACAW